MNELRARLRAVGPGLLFAGAAIGGSHLVQSTRAGAGWGFGLLWAVVLILILKYPFFEFAHRYTAATGESLLHGFRRLGTWALVLFFVVAALSSVINVAAVTLVTASLAGSLLQVAWSVPQLSVLVLAVVALILLIGRFGLLDRTMKVMITALSILTLAAVAVAVRHGPAGDPTFARPPLWSGAGVAFLLALMGWMPAPLDISVWSSLWTLEKNRGQPTRANLDACRFDFHLGYLVTGVLAVAFVSFGALVMFGTGETFSNSGLSFSHQLIGMYTATLGAWSGWLISLIAFITMFSTTLTVCDGYARTLIGCVRLLAANEDWRDRDAAGGRRSYALLLLGLMAGGWAIIAFWLGGIKTLLDVATITAFLTAPIVAWLNFAVVRRDPVAPASRPGPGLSWLSRAGIAYLVGFGLIFLATQLGLGG